MIHKFNSLAEDKRVNIINAALLSFAKNGYKKTSVHDISVRAGISKALVFHYFGSKKNLYLFLFDYCSSLIADAIDGKFDKDEKDYFKRLELLGDIQIVIAKKHPAMFAFLKSNNLETEEDFVDEIREINHKYVNIVSHILYADVDYSKFKDGVNPQMVFNIIEWCSEGYVYNSPKTKGLDVDSIFKEFDKYVALLKNSFYKEEFL